MTKKPQYICRVCGRSLSRTEAINGCEKCNIMPDNKHNSDKKQDSAEVLTPKEIASKYSPLSLDDVGDNKFKKELQADIEAYHQQKLREVRDEITEHSENIKPETDFNRGYLTACIGIETLIKSKMRNKPSQS